MEARRKLNAASVNGGLAVAALVGGMAGSWLVFGVALAGLLVSGLVGGDIRPGGGAGESSDGPLHSRPGDTSVARAGSFSFTYERFQ